MNRALRPTLVAQKATLRLRLLNASNARYYRLALQDHPLYLIAADGGFLEEPLEVSELLLAPGERAEVLVRLRKEGRFLLQALPYVRGAMGMMDMGGMAHAMPQGPSRPETLLYLIAPKNPKPLPLPKALSPFPTLPAPVVTRRLVLTEDMMAARFFINGQVFDHRRVDLKGQAQTVEVWEVENQGDMDHPFHLHVHPFQVLSVGGRPFPYRAWKDVVNLKAGEVARLLVPLREKGRTVFHCHIVEHEDRGMMGVLEVG